MPQKGILLRQTQEMHVEKGPSKMPKIKPKSCRQ
jgi:hypothetical protein